MWAAWIQCMQWSHRHRLAHSQMGSNETVIINTINSFSAFVIVFTLACTVDLQLKMMKKKHIHFAFERVHPLIEPYFDHISSHERQTNRKQQQHPILLMHIIINYECSFKCFIHWIVIFFIWSIDENGVCANADLIVSSVHPFKSIKYRICISSFSLI